MDITDTLNPILTYATLTASCALQTNLRFSTIKWIISSIALLLYILEMVMIVRITNFEEARGFNGTTAIKIQTITITCNRLIIVCAGIVNQAHILLFSHRSFVSIAQILLCVDGALETSEEQHKNDRKIVWCYIICSLMFLPTQLYYSYILVHIDPLLSTLFTFSIYINQGVTSGELQYIALCQIIRSRFKMINANLKNFKQLLKNEPRNLRTELDLLRQTHLTLTKLAQRTNSIYNIRLFFSFMCCMMNVLTNMYFMILGELEYSERGNGKRKSLKLIAILLLWALYYTVRLTMLCLASQLLCKEANASRGKVSKMVRYACNAGLKHEVMLFTGSLSLTQIDLKVARLAKMEVKLVVQVIASATTILVALAQILKS